MSYKLTTRTPTGRVPWPLILIEGPEKSGKSWACAQFSASKRVGQTYWIDLGEGAADEYGAIPDANYLVVEHDGSWEQISGAVNAIRDEAQRAADAGEPPVVLVIDSMTAEWDLLKDWTSNRARDRYNKKARQNNRPQLGADEEPRVSMDLWNDANGRHRKLMTSLMTFPGIVLVTARGKWAAAIGENGQPIEGKKEYKVEGQKSLGFDASCWIRLDRDRPGTVVGVRSVHVGIRPGYDDPIELAKTWTVEGVIFDTLKCEPASAHRRDLAELRPGADAPESPRFTALSLAIESAPDVDTLKRQWEQIQPALNAGEITEDEAKRASAAVTARKAALPQPAVNGSQPAAVTS